MNQIQKERVKRVADFISKNTPQTEYLPKGYQLVAAIWEVLQDGEWHTSNEIADRVGKSQGHVKEILQQVKDPWQLVTSTHKGFMLPTTKNASSCTESSKIKKTYNL